MPSKAAPPQRRTVRWRLIGAGALVTALCAVALVAVALVRSGEGEVNGPGRRLPPVDPDPGIVHVHGLGVDPATDAVFAATHTGLLKLLPGGAFERVANRAQDTMAFTIEGPGIFLGSGHPDFREDDLRPPLLGLIRSDNGGVTWAPLSLRGQADFHVLRLAGEQLYGYDSTAQAVKVTRDRRSWDTRASLPLRDLVADPSDSQHLLATGRDGLLTSTDGARTFRTVQGAPRLALLSWTTTGGEVFGSTADGQVFRSLDAGRTWAARGRLPGPPGALTASVRQGTPVLLVAVEDGDLLQSTDAGLTFGELQP